MEIVPLTSSYKQEVDREKIQLQVTVGGRSYQVYIKGITPQISKKVQSMMRICQVMHVSLDRAAEVFGLLAERFDVKRLRHKHQIEDAVRVIREEVIERKAQKQEDMWAHSKVISEVIESMLIADLELVMVNERMYQTRTILENEVVVRNYWEYIKASSESGVWFTHTERWQDHLIELLNQFNGEFITDEHVDQFIGLSYEEKAFQMEKFFKNLNESFLEKLFDACLIEFGDCVKQYCMWQLKVCGQALFKLKIHEILNGLRLKVGIKEGLPQSGCLLRDRDWMVTALDIAIQESFKPFQGPGSLKDQLLNVACYKKNVFEKMGVDDPEVGFTDPVVVEQNKQADHALAQSFHITSDVIDRYWDMIAGLPNGFPVHNQTYKLWSTFAKQQVERALSLPLWNDDIDELLKLAKTFNKRVLDDFEGQIYSTFMMPCPYLSPNEKIMYEYAALQIFLIGRCWVQERVRELLDQASWTLKEMPVEDGIDFEEAEDLRDRQQCSLISRKPQKTAADGYVFYFYGSDREPVNPWDVEEKDSSKNQTYREFFQKAAAFRTHYFKNFC